MTPAERKAFLIEMHTIVDDQAKSVAERFTSGPAWIAYPPGAELTSAQIEAVRSLAQIDPGALGAVIADSCAAALFHMFAVLDSVGAPAAFSDFWPQFHIAALDEDEANGNFYHDDFFDAYHDWAARKRDP